MYPNYIETTDQKYDGRIWNQYLVKNLKKIGFKRSKIDEFLFYKGKSMYALYADNSILADPNPEDIDTILKHMCKAKSNITEEGTLEDFLGVNLDRKMNSTIHLAESHLIDKILGDLSLLGEGMKTKIILTSPSKILRRHSKSDNYNNSFYYRSIIVKLSYLERGSQSDILYIVYQ